MCTYADAQNGKFYIVWLDSSVKNDYHYYIDEFDAASEKIVSTKDASSFVGSNILSYPKSIGVDSQNRFYLAVYDYDQKKYVINLISSDMKSLSSVTTDDVIYKFSGFDKTNGNYYVDIFYQQYYTPHYDNAVMLSNGDLVWTSTLSSDVNVLDSAKFNIDDKNSPVPLRFSISRKGFETEDRYADSIGTRTVYNNATADYLMYVNNNTIVELDADGNQKSSVKTAYPVFAMYNYGDSVLVIEKDTDENFYVENLKWQYPTKIALSKSSATVNVGESLALNATNDSILDISYKWASSDNSVASVTKDGKVYGNKAGSATITVKSENGVTASCKVTVQPPESNPEGGEVR